MAKMKINHYVVGQVQTNCYVVLNEENKECFIVDPGASAKQLAERIRKDGLTPVAVLLTHGHFDHAGAAEEFAKEEDLIFLCGHYEGIDERVLEEIVTDYMSIGDYVLTGGELPSMVMIDAISRLIPGVLNKQASHEIESFHDNLLEYPQYTRPEEWHGKKVPEVLLSGHHVNIEKWRREQSLKRTLERRPDLLENANLSKNDKKYLQSLQESDSI